MSAFPDWEKHVVIQRNRETGCIPTGYEILLRAAGKEIPCNNFQERFDQDSPRKNNFKSVATAVQKLYSHLQFEHQDFAQDQGSEKLKFIEAQIALCQPVLVSLAMEPFGARPGTYHIMPVVNSTDGDLHLFRIMYDNHAKEVMIIPKKTLIDMHHCYDGGHDVAYLRR